MPRWLSRIAKEWRALLALALFGLCWFVQAHFWEAKPRLSLKHLGDLAPWEFSPDGKTLLATRSTEHRGVPALLVIDTATGDVRQRHSLEFVNGSVEWVVPNFAANQVGVVVQQSHTVRNRYRSEPPSVFMLLDLRTGESLLPKNVPPETYELQSVDDVDCTPDGRRWLFCGEDGLEIQHTLLIDLEKKETRRVPLDRHGRVALHADGRRAACVTHSLPSRIAIWDLDTLREVVKLEGAELVTGAGPKQESWLARHGFDGSADLHPNYKRSLFASPAHLAAAVPMPPGGALAANTFQLIQTLRDSQFRWPIQASWRIDGETLRVFGERLDAKGDVRGFEARSWNLATGARLEANGQSGFYRWTPLATPFLAIDFRSDEADCLDGDAWVRTTIPFFISAQLDRRPAYSFGDRSILFVNSSREQTQNELLDKVWEWLRLPQEAATVQRWVDSYERGSARHLGRTPRECVHLLDGNRRLIVTNSPGERRHLELWDFPVPFPPHARFLLWAAGLAFLLLFCLRFPRLPQRPADRRYPLPPPSPGALPAVL